MGRGTISIVNPNAWRQKKQELATRDPNDITNQAIVSIKAQIRVIYLEQKKRYAPISPTTDSVKYEFCEGTPPTLEGGLFSFPIWANRRVGAKKPSRKKRKALQLQTLTTSPRFDKDSLITDAYAAFMDELKSRKGTIDEVSTITMGRWKKGLDYLTRFITEVEGGHIPKCHTLRVGWLNRYHRWLQQVPAGRHAAKGLGTPMSVEQASRYIKKIGDVFAFMLEEGLAETNPVALKKWPKGKGKDVYYFEPIHIEKLWQLTYTDETLAASLWWFKLMCVTGLDFPDAVRYVTNRGEYERMGIGGRKIVIMRNKPPHNECDIPMLPELVELLKDGSAPELAPATINRFVKVIASAVGFPSSKPVTIKTARKTAGALFLYKGFSIAAVSRILGHDSIQTTEKYYVKVLGSLVDKEMRDRDTGDQAA